MHIKKVFGRKTFRAAVTNSFVNHCPACDEIGKPVGESALNAAGDGAPLVLRCAHCGEEWHTTTATAAMTVCVPNRRPVGFWSGVDQRKRNRS